MKHKRIITIMISIVVIIVSCSVTQYAFANSALPITIHIVNCKDGKLKETLEEYYYKKYLILSNLEYDDSIKNYMTPQCDESEIIDIMVKHCNYQISDLRYNNNPIEVYLTVNDLSVNNENTIIKLNEYVVYTYNCEKNGIKTEEMIEHITTFDKNYKIVNDNYDYDFKNEYEAIIKEGHTFKEAKSQMLLASKESADRFKTDAQIEKYNCIFSINNQSNYDIINKEVSLVNTKASYSNHNYNRLAATNYALKYALSPNPNYMNIESNGGNCTNFTSQCIRAGGIKDDKTGDYKWYYTDANNRSPAWSSANEFRKYYKNNVGSTSVKGLKAKKCSFKESRKSDLVQWVTDGKAKHTMFIDDYACDNWGLSDPWNNKWDVYICQNSTSASYRLKHKLLSSKNIPSNQLEYIHIISCYY